MKNRYRAKINDAISLELTSDDILSYSIRGDGFITARDGNDRVDAKMVKADFLNKEYMIRMKGNYFKVNLESELQLLIDELGLAADVSLISNELTAPIPGLITEVLAEAGAAVKEGDGLLILEAMKMENKLLAAKDAVVKRIAVKKGDTVDKGMILIEFESNEEHS